MADSMTSMLKEDAGVHKNNDEDVPNLENGMQERDNVMQAVVKLPSNGGQISRVIPEQNDNQDASENSPTFQEKQIQERKQNRTLQRGNTDKALLNFNDQIKLNVKNEKKGPRHSMMSGNLPKDLTREKAP